MMFGSIDIKGYDISKQNKFNLISPGLSGISAFAQISGGEWNFICGVHSIENYKNVQCEMYIHSIWTLFLERHIAVV